MDTYSVYTHTPMQKRDRERGRERGGDRERKGSHESPVMHAGYVWSVHVYITLCMGVGAACVAQHVHRNKTWTRVYTYARTCTYMLT